jgi:signal transduction histidine kinase
MAGLMEEVLVLGRLDAGKLPFAPAPVEPGLLLARLVEEVQSATDYLSPIRLQADGLPAELHLDDKLVTHILSNLLSNAVKYSPPGTPVEFAAAVRHHQLEFCIRDRGIGIPEQEQERLFEAFHRGSNVGQRAGTGLGLVIVKRCVELHGGRIELQSRPGEGTTVTVRLPVPPPAPAAAPAPVPPLALS